MAIRIPSAPVLPLILMMLLFPSGYAASATPGVGFEHARLPNGTEVGIWYPSQGQAVRQRLGPYEQEVVPEKVPVGERLPLVVMSHGTGGSFAGHLDTAGALARGGFVVAALTHPGDNWRDQSGATRVEDRPGALEGLIGFMLDTWHLHRLVDPARVGAFGYSAGGFTVLAAAGGRPALSRMADHCVGHPAFFDCALLRSHPGPPGG